MEWIRVSSRSSTSVFGRRAKAGLRFDTGVGVRVAGIAGGEAERDAMAGDERDCRGAGSGWDLTRVVVLADEFLSETWARRGK